MSGPPQPPRSSAWGDFAASICDVDAEQRVTAVDDEWPATAFRQRCACEAVHTSVRCDDPLEAVDPYVEQLGRELLVTRS